MSVPGFPFLVETPVTLSQGSPGRSHCILVSLPPRRLCVQIQPRSEVLGTRISTCEFSGDASQPIITAHGVGVSVCVQGFNLVLTSGGCFCVCSSKEDHS